MDRKHRVAAALRHETTDFIPYSADFTYPEHLRVTEYTGDPSYLDRQGCHMTSAYYWGWPTETAPGSQRFLDAFGVLWNRTGIDKDIGTIDVPVLPEPTLEGFRIPPVDEPRLRADLAHAVATSGDLYLGADIGFSLFERAWTLRGMENVLIDMVSEPRFLDGLLDRIVEHDLQVLDIMTQYPLDYICLGDDWGQQRGTIMGPDLWRRFLKPRLRLLFAKIRSCGMRVILHSCGDIHELFPDLVEIGLDCYQTFQPEIYDLEDVKREFGADLSFWGGISTQRLLPCATPDEVRRVTARTLRIMGQNGGFIAGPTHSVPGDVPPENILAMFDVLRNQEKYV